MTLPPERIAVKRRRDEDPVEALYIQSKKQRPGVFWKLQSRPDGQQQPSLAPPAGPTGEKPTILVNDAAASSPPPQTPRDGETTAESKQSHAGNASPGLFDASFAAQAADGSLEGSKPSVPRRYQLSYESYHSLKRQPSFTDKVRKRLKPQKSRQSLAVFVASERAEELIQRTIREREGPSSGKAQDQQSQDHGSHVNEEGTIRKRPNTTAERAWRAATWSKQNDDDAMTESEGKNEPTTSWDAASIQVAQELQKIALDHSQAGPPSSPAAALKFKPKPPRPRQTTVVEQTTDVDMVEDEGSGPKNHSNIDEDGDYIIDTYIRAPLQTSDLNAQLGSHLDPFDKMDTGKVGILVIEEDQEKLWEDFADEDQNEEEIESDEEDENAEDFYGNDYPEDEVDVDDEYDRGNYNHRINASDDEEYGADEPHWSDGE